MKNPLFICILLGSLFSCTYDKEIDPEYYPQIWQLVKMTGQIQNSEQTGADMAWQESYLLNADGTFTKSRMRNGISTEASGTFSFKNLSGDRFLELLYDSKNGIIGSCTSEPKENLWIKSENKMLGTWSYCDGPGLEYERIK